jgi:hypothetical protein
MTSIKEKAFMPSFSDFWTFTLLSRSLAPGKRLNLMSKRLALIKDESGGSI